MSKPLAHLSIRIEPDEIDLADQVARALSVPTSRSAVLRAALRRGLQAIAEETSR